MVPHSSSLLYAKYTFLTFESCMFHNVLCLVFWNGGGGGGTGMDGIYARRVRAERAVRKNFTSQFFPTEQEGNINDWHSVKRNGNKTIKIESACGGVLHFFTLAAYE